MQRGQRFVEQPVEVVHIGAAPREQRARHTNRRIRREGLTALEIDEQRRALGRKFRSARHFSHKRLHSLANAHELSIRALIGGCTMCTTCTLCTLCTLCTHWSLSMRQL